MAAWRHIANVSESIFHCFQGYAARGERVQTHGNLGTEKIRKHTLQVGATLKCVLEKSVDHMLHSMHTLPLGEKIISRFSQPLSLGKRQFPKSMLQMLSSGCKKAPPSVSAK